MWHLVPAAVPPALPSQGSRAAEAIVEMESTHNVANPIMRCFISGSKIISVDVENTTEGDVAFFVLFAYFGRWFPRVLHENATFLRSFGCVQLDGSFFVFDASTG